VISLCIDEPVLRANLANKFTVVAINYQGWQKELLNEAVACVAVEPDPAAAATTLLALMDGPQRLTDRDFRARQLAEELFDRDQLAHQLEPVLLDAVGESS
jgi:hypothetical protein